ncbi:universal stress protein [Lunatimonas salinarum]|uniref:universal stress protein n=1 Tax=Lunatimonas salinarum TaxID=1774590 RepID=UPI001ADEF6EF|nr:universal stress protein [Lunatimonas salinarum]
MIQGLPDKIVALTDFSPSSDQAVELAAELAKRLKKPLEVFHATPVPPVPSMAGADIRSEILDVVEREGEASMRQFVKGLEERHVGTLLSSSVVSNVGFEEAVEQLVQRSPNCLLVFGKKNRSALERIFVGSGLTSLLRSGNVCAPMLLVSPESVPLNVSKLMLALDLKSKLEEERFDLVAGLLAAFKVRWDLVYATEGKPLEDAALEQLLVGSLPADLIAKMENIYLLESKEEIRDRATAADQLIVAFPKRKTIWESIFKGSFSEFLAAHQDRLLLLVPDTN